MDGVALAIFPCNQFGSQEPASDDKIKAFAESKGVDSANTHVLAKGDVNGKNTGAMYQLVKAQTGMEIGWNFQGGFVVDKAGTIQQVKDMGQVEDIVKGLL